MANRALFHPERAIQLWCSNCKRLTTSKKWLCTCGKGCMSCSVHSPLAYSCKARLTLKKRVRLGLVQGLDAHRASTKRRKILMLWDLGNVSPCGAWPLPPPPPHGPSGPRPRKKRCVAPGPPPPSTLGFLGSYRSPRRPGPSVVPLVAHTSTTFPPLQVSLDEGPANAQARPRKHARGTLSCWVPVGPGRASSERPPGMPSQAPSRPPFSPTDDTCVSGTGQCPASGWTIDQYCPKCHGWRASPSDQRLGECLFLKKAL